MLLLWRRLGLRVERLGIVGKPRHRVLLLTERHLIVPKDHRVALLQLLDHLLTVLQLHQRWLEILDGEKHFPTELIRSHDLNGSLEHIVTELVVNQSLDDEVDPNPHVLGILTLETELSDDLVVVSFGPSAFEDLVNVRLAHERVT